MKHDEYGCLGIIFSLIVTIAMVLFMTISFNSCSEDEWNDGICGECNVPYELVDVSKGLKYYACPECYQEVARYGSR
jgi:hypothetical protein